MDDGPIDDYFQVSVDSEATPPRVTASGEIDAASAEEFGQAIDSALEAGGGVVLDLGAVTFMDSSGLRVIAVALRRAREHDRPFTVAPASDAVQRIFDITGVTALLNP
ncbi:STAS domain-containing protein [Aquihabitans sp. McL0605]|uniref:STAS domain-containing protein n=1 Tax=Aquihabitans sp. McL0605 TaxID=3415671 RepID=UPI003CF083A3